MSVLWWIVVVWLVVCIVVVLSRKAEETEFYQPPSCIITMTTHMGFKDRFHHLPMVLDPLVRTGQEMVVVNEWDENGPFYTDYMRKHYPQVRFLQKSYDDRGQARSLNILVRDHLLHSPHKYWVHWEDTWVCTRPLFPNLVDMMEQHPEVSQLQLTDDWKGMPHSTRLRDITLLSPPPMDNDQRILYDRQIELGSWPLFSLRPSIHRLSFFQRHAKDFYFLEHPHLWPLRFEWEFGKTFLRNKGVKAITNQPYAQRTKHYKSTYADLLKNGPHATREKSVGGY